MGLKRKLSLCLPPLLMVWAVAAQGQGTDRPGPMQSGTHVAPAASESPGPGAAPTPAAGSAAGFDVNKLFANTCGWCHHNGGREPGKGPRLMETTLTDAEIINRIKNGKPGQMPAFGSSLNDEQLRAIVAYIRSLKPAQ